jgi:hypothetical protein
MARTIRWRGVLSPDGPGDGRAEPATWQPTDPVRPPRSIVEAVRAMQVGAALSVLEVVRALVFRGDLRDAFLGELAREGRTVDPADVDAVVTLALTVTTVIGVVAASLWFTLSRVTARGSRWGRIVASVLLAAGFGLFFAGGQATAGPLARWLAVLQLLVGVLAVVRLWHRDSSAWIRYQSSPQD